MTPLEIYNANIGNNHDAAVAAVHAHGHAAGFTKAMAELAKHPSVAQPVVEPAPPPAELQL